MATLELTTSMNVRTPVIHDLYELNRIGNLPLTGSRIAEETVFQSIRCPLCSWRPDSSSRWCCQPVETPEPFFPGCGAVWNTFSTRGRCPGCDHQWRWTSCLSCGGWSLHEDWYEHETGHPGR